jgi:hypothetical protein
VQGARLDGVVPQEPHVAGVASPVPGHLKTDPGHPAPCRIGWQRP